MAKKQIKPNNSSESQIDLVIPEPQALTKEQIKLMKVSCTPTTANEIKQTPSSTTSIVIPKPRFLTNEKLQKLSELKSFVESNTSSPDNAKMTTDTHYSKEGDLKEQSPHVEKTSPVQLEKKPTQTELPTQKEFERSSSPTELIKPRQSPIKTDYYQPLSRETSTNRSPNSTEISNRLNLPCRVTSDLRESLRYPSTKFVPKQSIVNSEYQSYEVLRSVSERMGKSADYPFTDGRGLTRNMSYSKDRSMSERDFTPKRSPTDDYPSVAGQSFKLSSKRSPTTSDYLTLRDLHASSSSNEYETLNSLKSTGKSPSAQHLKQLRSVQLPIKPISPDRHLTNDTRKRLYDQITNRQPSLLRQQRPADMPSKYRLTEERYRNQYAARSNDLHPSALLSPERSRRDPYSFMSDLQRRHDVEHTIQNSRVSGFCLSLRASHKMFENSLPKRR